MEREESWSSASYGLVLEAGTIYRVFQGTGEAETALHGCWLFPGLLEGGPHVECGRLQRLLAFLPSRLMRRQAMQRVEGSERGLDSLSQRSLTQN